MTTPLPPLTPPERQGHTSFATSLALLTLRLVLGWIFVYAGSQKLFGAFDAPFTIQQFSEGLKDMPVLPPLAWAYLAAGAEFLGGVAVLLGLLTRVGSALIFITMLVAIVHSTGQNGFMGPGGYAFNLALIAMALALLLAGAGIVSLDALLFKRGLWARGPQPLESPVAR